MVAEQDFFSVQELADKLGVSKDTVYRLIRKGELPYHQIGRAIRFRWADVEEYLKRVRKEKTD
jgi:excisionase family DNA binding protein